MSVWLTIPSARPPEEANPCLKAWVERGYNIALWLDASAVRVYDHAIVGPYPGYANAVNGLIADRLKDSRAEWFVIGGDDTWPDPNKSAEDIARECREHFQRKQHRKRTWGGATFGVMQPTGDRFAEGQIDRICGSAWIGREFAQRVNLGNGPLWPEYTHMFVDEELQNVAIKYGVLWQRPDLVQFHKCYARESDAIDSPAIAARWPSHITHDGYTPEHWEKYKALFERRKAEGFPGSELK